MSLHRNTYAKITAITAAAYQIKADADDQATFTTRGAAAAVTFTLPPVANVPTGWWCEFFNVSAFGLVVASHASSDNIVTLNDATADTLTATSTSLMIGVYVRVIWDGTGWLAIRGAGGTITGA